MEHKKGLGRAETSLLSSFSNTCKAQREGIMQRNQSSDLSFSSKNKTSTLTVSNRAVVTILTLILLLWLSVGVTTSQAATSVGLGTADSFAILAGSGVTNTGPSVINGDLGTSPLPAVVGFGGGPSEGTVNGAIHQADTVAASAQADLTTAYDNAAGQGPANTVVTELGGQSLTPGVYDSASGTFEITGPLTLNAQGDPNAVFIFKTSTTLVSASSSSVNLINGAQPCNIFWQVGSSATLGSNSVFVGNILALTSISLDNAVSVSGRLLARNGAVTLDNDTVTRVPCATSDGGSTGGGGAGGGSAGGGGDGEQGDRRPGNRGNRGPGASPRIFITGVPIPNGGPDTPSGANPVCVEKGFLAKFRIRGSRGMRSVKVFVDGKLIKRSRSKQVSVWVNVTGLRAGKNTIRVVAVDRLGRQSTASRTFRKCAPAIAPPSFTG